MENASKALIIAGAILLAILLISLGIMIYNQASGVVDNNAMDEVAIQSFNQKFEQYFGPKVRGSNVNALLSAVNTNNGSTDDASKKITIKGLETGKTKVETGKSYKVEATKHNSGGLIEEITISEAK